MGGSFEQLIQEVFLQKRLKEDLEAENHYLHQKLAELRSGYSISVEVLGQRFSLTDEPPDIPQGISSVEQLPFLEPEQPTEIEMPIIPDAAQLETQQISKLDQPARDYSPATPPTALEEMLTSELRPTTPTPTIRPEPEAKPQQKSVNEHEKAALRRELSGSFLLE